MTPAARVAAAADILDLIIDGTAAEKSLTTWGRKNRYAGSKDRAAIRDHVFQALRSLRSYAALGGAADDAPTGRALMIGALRAEGIDPASMFTGEGYAPKPLTEDELAGGHAPVDVAAKNDFPDWLWPVFEASLGDGAEQEAALLKQRAPVFLRVNTRKTNREAAVLALAEESIVAQPHALSETALEVLEGARKVALSDAFSQGLVELQDAASQAVVDTLPLEGVTRVLDYCAGGGGKSLAIAARCDATVYAHDIDEARMRDIPVRKERAGAAVTVVAPDALADHAPFDVVLCDAPCSGSGAWRRSPESKWRLTAESLAELRKTQLSVLQSAAHKVTEGGVLAYVTCSVLSCENEELAAEFCANNPEWQCQKQESWTMRNGGDGFFVAILTRSN
ncbi:RsmB/NOP family class I SAM-dependent RNA methyltransferase [Lentibacter algarum]|uniref:RsmB/NOP family class I SAM-dependent RNA methyltransferase n=1 Tax=Lentibacter algarum TaxID=576131 RepID=UPI001C07C83D|nr:RsmB/NOP family class I SAM-dependent RNA methyltransferase [Lentibacter algarum]MBU2982180.1 RsmB/NOP family class I SAM-dependent RNA methyltransferase [Lentibacter algarum]